MEKTIETWTEEYVNEFYFKGFLERYPRWLENVSTDEEKKVLNKVLMKMEFYSRLEIKEILGDKIKAYKPQCNGFENTNIFPMVSRNRRYNGSYEIIAQLVELDKEMEMENNPLFPYKETVLMDIRNIANDTDTVITVDDICGTGGTLDKFLYANRKYFNRKRVIVLFLVVTKVAIKEIKKIKQKYYYLDLIIDYCYVAEKLSDTKYLLDEELKVLEVIEKTLWNEGNKNILGFRDSQLLVGFSHNIPNNSISSIWYKNELGIRKDWNPLFARYTKKSKVSKQERKEQNYSAKRHSRK